MAQKVDDKFTVIKGDEYYRDNRFIEALGGDTPRNRVLDFFVINQRGSYHPDDISDAINLDWYQIEHAIKELQRQGVVAYNESGLYSVVKGHPYFQDVLRLEARTLVESIEETKRQYKL